MAAADSSLYAQRLAGQRPCGEVTLRDFDQGMVETLGGVVLNGQYYIQIDGIMPPAGEPGLPVHFMYPEDLFADLRFPCFVVNRDDISSATMRLHPGLDQYRAPAPTAQQVQIQTPFGVRNYYDRTVQMAQAVPYDITYSINIYNTKRGGYGGKKAVNAMLDYVLRKCPIYGQMFVKDSVGDTRSYEMFQEGISSLDDVAGVAERYTQFAVTFRVEAEYDLNPVREAQTVRSRDFRYNTLQTKG